MPKRTHHIVVVVLLASYLLVGVLAHLSALTQFLGSGTRTLQVTQGKPERPIAAKVYWTQNKHIPSVTKLWTPSPAVLSAPEPPRPQQYGLLQAVSAVAVDPAPAFSSFFSRGPPKS
jgi:hypothetical protein